MNYQEQEPTEDRVTTEGWLLVILVVVALVLSVQLQLAHSAVLQDNHDTGQVMRGVR